MLPPQTHPPTEPIRRRHTPPRLRYRAYRACLRWEFGFTCSFCLLHEADLVEEGARASGLTTIEHHIPKSADETLIDTYENCFYACRYCNRARGIAPVAQAAQRLLDPCSVAWAEHFVVSGDELRPRPGDADAAYTHEAYGIDAPRKVAYREARRRRIDDAHKALREIPDAIDQLLNLAERVAKDDRPDVLRSAERLRRALDGAAATLARYRAIPVDHDVACRCGTSHELPAFLAAQVAVANPAPAVSVNDEGTE